MQFLRPIVHCIFGSGIPLCYICKQKLVWSLGVHEERNVGCHEELAIYEVSIHLVKLSLPLPCYEQEWMFGSTTQSCSSEVTIQINVHY